VSVETLVAVLLSSLKLVAVMLSSLKLVAVLAPVLAPVWVAVLASALL
jgi:hypothetical protein